MSDAECIARFLDKHARISGLAGRYATGYVYPTVYWAPPLAEELAARFLEDAEFEALALGSWLGTPQGKLFVEAAEMLEPRWSRPELELLLDALKLAAAERRRGDVRAERVLLGGVVTAVALWMATRWSPRPGTP